MTSPIRIGLIGTGRIGQVHAATIDRSHDFELTYTCDTFIAGAENIQSLYGSNITDDPEVLLNSGEVDAILVASPTPTHLGLIERAIDLKIHVLCEKPIDLDIDRVDALREKAAQAESLIAIGFNRRFDPGFNQIHARVAAGEIGEIEQLIIISRDPSPAPQEYIHISGGIFRDMTIHDFDMARYFIPNIVEVSATGANVFSDYIAEEGDYDSVVVTLKGANNELVTIVNSRHASFGYDQRLEAFGSLGMLTASNLTPTSVQLHTAEAVEVREPYFNFFLERYALSYQNELADFAKSIRTGTAINPNYEDGRAALVLANAALESAKTGKAVKL